MKTLFLLLSVAITSLFAPIAQAGDVLWHLTHSAQDVLALIEVVKIENDKAVTKPYFFFPQGKNRPAYISLNREQDWLDGSGFPECKALIVGKKYFASLKKTKDGFVPDWGLYEVHGTSYTDAQFVRIHGADATALEWFMHSGGRDNEFLFANDTVYVHKDNTNIPIYSMYGRVEPMQSNRSPAKQEAEHSWSWYWVFLPIFGALGIW